MRIPGRRTPVGTAPDDDGQRWQAGGTQATGHKKNESLAKKERERPARPTGNLYGLRGCMHVLYKVATEQHGASPAPRRQAQARARCRVSPLRLRSMYYFVLRTACHDEGNAEPSFLPGYILH